MGLDVMTPQPSLRSSGRLLNSSAGEPTPTSPWPEEGKTPGGQYQGQLFTVTLKGEYSGYGMGTLVIGEAKVFIGSEQFTSVVFSDVGKSFCCGEGGTTDGQLSVTGWVLHKTSAGPHYHLFGALASTGGTMCINIVDQTGTVVDPADPPCNPGIGLICEIPAVVRIGPVVTVPIDIKPGTFPNSINPRSNGVIPVAILTTETFDATTVDPLSVEFGPGKAKESHKKGHLEDANGDGRVDMIVHFRTDETGIQCGATQASLSGWTLAGQYIEGTDAIVTVGCGSAKSAVAVGVPITWGVEQNYPNPFNPSTTIRFELPEASLVRLSVFDILGREVSVLVNERREAGVHEVTFNASGLSSGIYYYRIQAGNWVTTKSLMVLK
jgi:hypothetical protein